MHALSAVLYAFATHPDQWRRLRDNPSLARVAFDEAVRRESPVQTFFRTTTTAVRVGDVRIPEGRKVLTRRHVETPPQQHPPRLGIAAREGASLRLRPVIVTRWPTR